MKTVSQAGRRSSNDSSLLTCAEQHFDVFITIDRKLERQHDLTKLHLALIIIRVPDNRLASYIPLFDRLLAAVKAARPGDVIHVPD